MTNTRTHARSESSPARAVSRPHDPAEQQADKAADVVARGGSVTGWSFASVADSAVHRQDDGGAKPDDDKKKPDTKTAESDKKILESPAGEKVQQSVLDLPEVKKAIEFAKTPAGIGLGVGLGAAGVTALAANHKPLPFQPPAIPLDGIGLKGLSAKVEYQGPVDRPTGVGLSLTYTEQGPAKKKGPSDKEKFQAETARLKAEQDKFRAGLRPAREQQAQDEATQQAVADYVARHSALPGVGRPLIPATGGSVTITPAPAPTAEPPTNDADQKKPDDAPVQREPATMSESAAPDTSRVDAAVRGSGRPLDPSVRRSMEARFGYDFSQVRLHDDAGANSAANDAQAAAFTIGSDIVLAAGKLDTRTPAGRRLLAHELAHVIQQAGQAGPVLHRRNVFETIGIWLGLVEGTFDDRELHAYLDGITAAKHIEGSYDADNKARAIVRKWKQASAGYDLLANQKSLLIAEMLDGPTGDDDETAILDLLELSDGGDLRAMFWSKQFTLERLESDINGSEHDRLESFLSSRFDGGRDAVAAGRIKVVGPPVPAGAPAFTFDPATVDSWVDSDRTSEEIIAIVEHLAPATRTLVLHHLSQVRRPRMLTTLQGYERKVRDAPNAGTSATNMAFVDAQRTFMLKVERVLLHFFLTAIPATAADLVSGTSPTDPARQTELREALRTPASSSTAHFRNQIPGETGTYESKLRAALPGIVDEYFQSGVTKRPPRTHTLNEFEALANVSKDETDKVFGQFYSPATHPAFVADQPGVRGNLHDAFEDTKADQDLMTPDQHTESARQMLTYLLRTDDAVAELDRHHEARPAFDDHGQPTNDEARLQDQITRDLVGDATNVDHLLAIDRNWDASAQRGQVFVQLFQPTDAKRDRLLLWDMFQTLIHEYIHTLRADEYDHYADSFGGQSAENNTLIEGMDSVLDEVVWEHVLPRVKSKELREKIEGAATAATPPIDVPHASQRRYPSYTQALKLVDLVGIRNVYAAYFLGLVDRIGGPAPGAAP